MTAAPGRTIRARCLGLALCLMPLACGEDGPTEGALPHPGASRDGAAPAVTDVRSLLAALGQSHATVRRAIGSHRLHWTGTFELTVPEATEPPRVDGPAVRPQAVQDELSLVWVARDGGLRFALSQHNDHDRGRDVVVDGERIFVKQRHRRWVEAPLETDHYEVWLDDAQHAIHDIVQLAAPALAIAIEPSEDGAELHVRLSTSDTIDRELYPTGAGRGWRQGATLEEIRGEIVLDAATSTWRSADVYVQYALPGPDGRILRGTNHVRGTVERLAEGVDPIGVPGDAMPLPERIRYEEERLRLLDGLAAP